MTYDRNRLVSNFRVGLEWLQKQINTCIPGKVVSFDAATARAVVQPTIQVRLRSGATSDLPQIHDVPVVYPAGGGYSITFPLVEDDPVLLVFSQRGMTQWKSSMDTAEPDVGVFHALNDAIAIPGIATSGISENGLQINTPLGGAILINGVSLDDYIMGVVNQP